MSFQNFKGFKLALGQAGFIQEGGFPVSVNFESEVISEGPAISGSLPIKLVEPPVAQGVTISAAGIAALVHQGGEAATRPRSFW